MTPKIYYYKLISERKLLDEYVSGDFDIDNNLFTFGVIEEFHSDKNYKAEKIAEKIVAANYAANLKIKDNGFSFKVALYNFKKEFIGLFSTQIQVKIALKTSNIPLKQDKRKVVEKLKIGDILLINNKHKLIVGEGISNGYALRAKDCKGYGCTGCWAFRIKHYFKTLQEVENYINSISIEHKIKKL